MKNISEIRKDFPILETQVYGRPLIYLDNAATTQVPRQVLDTVQMFYETSNSNVHRGVHYLSEQSTSMYEAARNTVARFLNAADPSEIIFTSGTTAAVNMAARGLEEGMLREGDEVIVTRMEHHSDFVPWQQACRRSGAVFKIAELTDNGDLDLEDLAAKLTERTKIVAFCAVSNVLGTVNPVKKIAQMAHAAGAMVFLDAAQAVRHMKLDVQELECDFLCFSGHKMMGPSGTGVLYGRAESLAKLVPNIYGGGMVDEVLDDVTSFDDAPGCFEAGTPNYQGAVGLAAAIDYLEDTGLDEISAYEAELLRSLEDILDQFPNVRILGKPEVRAGAISIDVPGVSPYDMAVLMDKLGVASRSGHHCAQPLLRKLGLEYALRFSPAFYNTGEEIAHAAEALEQTLRILGAG